MTEIRIPLARRPQIRAGAVVVVVAVAGLVAWLLLRGGGSPTVPVMPAHAVSSAELAALPTTVHHPVFWAGPQSRTTVEVNVTHAGLVFVRYLPPGVPVGVKRRYLTVGTYPVDHPLATLRALAKRLGTQPVTLVRGGLAVSDTSHPSSVYAAFPGLDYQVEVFAPAPAQARNLVLSGRVVPIGAHAGPAPPLAATVTELRNLAAFVGHDLYWAGAEPGVTYEHTQTTDGRIYIRYLPHGVAVGSTHPYLTVGTYPAADAVAAVRQIAKRIGGRTFAVPGGGVGVVDRSHPTSVYLAFKDSSYEIEVFDPAPGQARRIVGAGAVIPVR